MITVAGLALPTRIGVRKIIWIAGRSLPCVPKRLDTQSVLAKRKHSVVHKKPSFAGCALAECGIV